MKICYFGIYNPTAPRDKIYFDGLKKQGIEILECVDSSSGLSKYFRLWKKHKNLKGEYDILWVGYLSALLVPLAYAISSKKIIFNALASSYETYVLDRAVYSKFSPRAWLFWVLDFFAFHLADISLIESEEQKKFISRFFFISSKKLKVVFTGADEEVFHPDPSTKNREEFTAVFRGMFLPATGAEYVIEAARILEKEDVKFLVIGWGQELPKIENLIEKYKLTNVELVTYFLPADELRRRILECHVMLGQFGANKRMDRTIQHKTFEALALGMPYITRDSLSNREILEDGGNCLFVPPESPEKIAEKIIFLKGNPEVRQRIGKGGRETFEKKVSEEVLSKEVLFLVGQ